MPMPFSATDQGYVMSVCHGSANTLKQLGVVVIVVIMCRPVSHRYHYSDLHCDIRGLLVLRFPQLLTLFWLVALGSILVGISAVVNWPLSFCQVALLFYYSDRSYLHQHLSCSRSTICTRAGIHTYIDSCIHIYLCRRSPDILHFMIHLVGRPRSRYRDRCHHGAIGSRSPDSKLFILLEPR
jgi:hypothetical protein